MWTKAVVEIAWFAPQGICEILFANVGLGCPATVRRRSMRQKRAKAYKRLVHQYVLHYGFREPFQILGRLLLAAYVQPTIRLRSRSCATACKTLCGS